MDYQGKTREQLIEQLHKMRQRIATLEALQTEHEQTEKQLRRLAAVIDSTDDAVFSKDLDGTINSWNNAAELLFGYSAEEIIGRSVTNLVPNGHTDVIPNILSHIKQGERVDQFEAVRMRKDGTLLNVSLTVSPIRNANGQIVAASTIAHDITQRIRKEEECQWQADELAKRYRELNCLYDISYLIDTPDISLTEILQGTVDLLPSVWQYPEIASARILMPNHDIKTTHFQQATWNQVGDILVHGQGSGSVEVHYIEEKPERDEGPFLKEERSLIDAIGERLGRVIERMQAEEERDALIAKLKSAKKE